MDLPTTTDILIKQDFLNKKYAIESFPYNVEDLNIVRTAVNTEMEMYPMWNAKWVDEYLLVRFLRTFDTVEETTEKLLEYFDWRCNGNIDNINLDDPVMQEIRACGVNLIFEDNYDVCGRPIMVIYCSRQIKDATKSEYLLKSAVYFLERLCEKSDATELRTFTIVFDLGGFTVANIDFSFLQTYISYLKNFYPERLGVALIINYPLLADVLWKVIKLWMDRHLRSRFLFCDKEKLGEFIELENLPVKLIAE